MNNKNTALIESIFTLSRLMKEDMAFNSDFATLSMLQIQTLLFLKQNPQAQMGEIASKFAIELPSATSLITKLVKAKLVIRRADKKDRRVVHIALTEKGDALLTDAMRQRNKRIEKHLSFLSEQDIADLLRIVNVLIKNLEKNNEK